MQAVTEAMASHTSLFHLFVLFQHPTEITTSIKSGLLIFEQKWVFGSRSHRKGKMEKQNNIIEGTKEKSIALKLVNPPIQEQKFS